MPDGGQESFVAFVASRQRALLRAATLVSGDHHLAQDLVQDALVKLARVWHRVGPDHPEAYAWRFTSGTVYRVAQVPGTTTQGADPGYDATIALAQP